MALAFPKVVAVAVPTASNGVGVIYLNEAYIDRPIVHAVCVGVRSVHILDSLAFEFTVLARVAHLAGAGVHGVESVASATRAGAHGLGGDSLLW